MSTFTPLSATLGGLLIGLSAAGYLWLAGRYAGLSGIIRSAAFGDADRVMDRLFLVGMLAAAAAWFALAPTASAVDSVPLPLVAAAGVLVGVGTSLSGGCTSGHGVCGLGRLSPRSLAAVVTFMAMAMLTVYVVRHVAGIA